MNSYRFYEIIIILSLCVVFLVDLNVQAAKLKSRQSGSQIARQQKRKKDANSVSENKLHFQSKLVIALAIGDYEADFFMPQNEVEREMSKRNKTRRTIELGDVMRNSTADGHTCRKEIQDRKLQWKMQLENPLTERIAKLRTRVVNNNNQFTLEEFCQAVAILYQRVNDDLDLEARKLENSADNPISKYSRTNFVIPFLLEDYPGEISKPVKELIAEELRKT